MQIYVYTVRVGAGFRDAVSFLSPEQMKAQGLRSEVILGELLQPPPPGQPITPDLFRSNPTFVEFMHDVIARRAPSEPELIAEARRQHEGHVQIIDGRTVNPTGEVPRRDVVGRFAVHEGEIVPDSYEACLEHQVLSEDGFLQLGPDFEAWLAEELAAGPRSAD